MPFNDSSCDLKRNLNTLERTQENLGIKQFNLNQKENQRQASSAKRKFASQRAQKYWPDNPIRVALCCEWENKTGEAKLYCIGSKRGERQGDSE